MPKKAKDTKIMERYKVEILKECALESFIYRSGKELGEFQYEMFLTALYNAEPITYGAMRRIIDSYGFDPIGF